MEEYYSDMVRRAREVSASDEMTRFAMVRGLRPALRTYVMQQNPATNDELLAAAKVSEATVIESSPTITTEILDAIRRLEACAATSIRESCRSPVRSSSPSLRPRSASTSRPERRVRFDDDRREFRQGRATNAATFNDRRGQPFEGPDYSTTPPTPPSPRRRDQPGHKPYVHRRIDLRPPQDKLNSTTRTRHGPDTDKVRARCRVRAKFHYTDPTGPARTQRSFAAKKVRAGPCGSGRVRVGSVSVSV